MEARRGDWIETYSGIAFWPLDVHLDEISFKDITHTLSQQCRFTGHTKYFFSVAQHSLNVMRLIQMNGGSPQTQLCGLLHDASEAYICDIAKPVKPYLDNYEFIEAGIMDKIWEFVGITPTEEDMKIVKYYDYVDLMEEGCALMPNKLPWAEKTTFEVDLSYRDMEQVEYEFLSEINRLLAEIK